MPRPSASEQALMELSLRHLPDLSDASFEIPRGLESEDLLAHENDGFLTGADDSLITPPREHEPRTFIQPTPPQSTAAPQPLTLEELTPKPMSRQLKVQQQPHPVAELSDTRSEGAAKPPKLRVHPAVQALREKLRERKGKHVEAHSDTEQRRNQTIMNSIPEPVDKLETPGPSKLTQQLSKDVDLEPDTKQENVETAIIEHAKTASTSNPSRLSKEGQKQRNVPKMERPAGDKLMPNARPTTAKGDTSKRPKRSKKMNAPILHAESKLAPVLEIITSSALAHPAVRATSGESAYISVGATGGAAERLLLYGQALVGSAGFIASGFEASDNIGSRQDVNGPISPPGCQDGKLSSTLNTSGELQDSKLTSALNISDDPLTLSQLSPKKIETADAPEPIRVPSPISRPDKRSAPAATDSDPSRSKRGKPDLRSSQMTKKVISLKPSNPTRRTVAATRSRTANAGSKIMTQSSNDIRPGTSKLTKGSKTVNASVAPVKDSNGSSQSRSLRSSRKGELKPSDNSVKPSQSGKPAGFDTRSEPRSRAPAGTVDRRGKDTHLVPDFKAIHAAEAELRTSRKENVMPVAPVAHEMHTEIRAREREEFDRIVRAKEMELERQKEERRLQQELEEEMEIRELRKKAVPRAHDVPEWYADVPKRQGTAASRGD